MVHVKASEAFKKATHYLDMQASILSRNRILNKCLKEMTPTQVAHVKHDPRESGKKGTSFAERTDSLASGNAEKADSNTIVN